MGCGQLFGVSLSAALLVHTGVTRLTLWAVLATTALTAISLALFGGRRGHADKDLSSGD